MKSINLASVDLNLLVAFEAIFETRSVTAAANRLRLGQPAMSAALGRLRALLDDDLFVRVGREMKPTPKAHRLAPEISAALGQIQRTLELSQTFDPATTPYTFGIGSSDYISAVIMPKLLQYCQKHAPNIDFRLLSFEKDQIADLLGQQIIEIVLGTFQDLPRQTYQTVLMEERFVGVCRRGHPALQAGTMPLETFVALPHALFTLRRDEVGVIDHCLETQGLQRRIVLTTPYLLALPSLISESDTIAAIPYRLAQRFAQQGLLTSFELPLELAPWSIAMLWSKLTDQSVQCQWLRQTIQQICQDL
jgi:DNA-binding transcriptional LysR family regulator